jgi:glutamate racemase
MSPPSALAPIGIFDSGVGGLSVMQEIRQLLPREDLIYAADSGHVPYGSKPPEFIAQRAKWLTEFLLGRGCKAVVIACNTATASAAAVLRREWPGVPIIGMEPAVKPAAAASRSKVVGVLATVGTLQSAQFAALLDKFAQDVRVVAQGCPGLVECVEAGRLRDAHAAELAARYVRPLLEKGADCLVLGCTHYPFLRDVIRDAAGEHVAIIDTGRAVARQVERRLAEGGLLHPPGGPVRGTEEFWTTGATGPQCDRVFGILWGAPVSVRQLPP